MLGRTTALAALAAAALAAGGTTATVVLSASDRGVTASSERTEHAKAGAEHGKSADAAAKPAKAADAADTAVEAPPCPADVKNHGAYVSSVAKAESPASGTRGEVVSAAAKSDCGKPEGGSDEDAAEDSAKETREDKAAKGSKATGQANASEKGKAGQQLGAARGKSAEHAPARPTR